MTRPAPLTDPEIADFLAAHPGWRAEGGALVRRLRFADFSAAFGFLARLALAQEAAGHHAEIHHTYNRVTLRLTTHDAGGRITAKDTALASAADALAGGAGG
jgi:4a-hydroxytetrahydrobiopterin dehydratase